MNLEGVQFLLLQATANGCSSSVVDFPLQDPGVLSANILGDDSLFVCMNSEEVLLQSANSNLNVWSTGSASPQIYVYEEGPIILTRSNACEQPAIQLKFWMFLRTHRFLLMCLIRLLRHHLCIRR
ncbi:MAG: hypothetical protein R2850_06320 [Bacteroidia bacterium]